MMRDPKPVLKKLHDKLEGCDKITAHVTKLQCPSSGVYLHITKGVSTTVFFVGVREEHDDQLIVEVTG